jgi:hypothetical protein
MVGGLDGSDQGHQNGAKYQPHNNSEPIFSFLAINSTTKSTEATP